MNDISYSGGKKVVWRLEGRGLGLMVKGDRKIKGSIIGKEFPKPWRAWFRLVGGRACAKDVPQKPEGSFR